MDYHAALPRRWGITILEDQSQGWAIMALAEGTAYLIAVLLLVAKMAEHEERIARSERGISR